LKKKKVYGVKFPSLLLALPRFDIIWGIPVDYMHSVTLGVAKKLVSLFFDSTYASFPWYLGNKIESIDQHLKALKPPRQVKRLPRSLHERQHWKGLFKFDFFFF